MSTGQMPLPAGVDTSYPPAPWTMHGQLWLSLFRVRPGDHPDRDPGDVRRGTGRAMRSRAR